MQNEMTITVVYDNNPYKQGLETGWGFSCLITGLENTILFDTGRESALLGNMEKLGIEPESIDTVVLSHIHPDHTGGIASFLEKNSKVIVYLPKSFSKRFKEDVENSGAKTIEVEQTSKICENTYSTGLLGKLIKEQALVIRTETGLIVISGCAHPSIVKIVNAAKDLLKDKIILVIGGFHLEWATRGKIEKIISAFKKTNVHYIGPCHCTNDKARSLLKEHFGENYIKTGAGKIIKLADLR